MIKKILFFFFCFVIVFYNISFCYNKVLIEKSNNYLSANKIRLSASNLKPNTYSKNIIAIDRKSLNVLYEKVLNFDPSNPDSLMNDKVILSKGHAALALYCALYEKGLISKEELNTFEANGSNFVAHSKRDLS